MNIEPKPKDATYNDEQWQAIQQVGGNLLIAASAGSGKTTVLIERILTHIRKEFAQIDELLVVTFTEAAANEMKERMEVKLKEALYDSSESSVNQGLLLNQIQKLPTAHIRTLHSFCLQVIQQFFYLIDFNPTFSLLTDETQKQLLYQEVWEKLVTDIIEDKVDGFSMEILRDLLSRYAKPRDDKELFDLILDLHLFSSSHPEPTVWLEHLADNSANFRTFANSTLYQQQLAPDIEANLQVAYQQLLIAESRLEQASSAVIERYQSILVSQRETIGQLLEFVYAGDLEGLMSSVQSLQFDRWPATTKKFEDEKEFIAELKSDRDKAKSILTEYLQKLFKLDYADYEQVELSVAPIINKLGQLTQLFKDYLRKRKIQLNLIDYNDLEHLTLDILAPYNKVTGRREGSLAAKYYQQLFKEVLVDEYQDINEIQATILSWLSHEQRPDLQGNLFMVGDVKQSIYGFRMAEPSLFMKKYRDYQENKGGQLIVLDKNYRSREEVLQFTNYVFERIMDEQFGEMAYDFQESLKTGNHLFEPSAPHFDFNIQLLLHEKREALNDEANDEVELLGFDSSLEIQSHLIAQNIIQRIQNNQQIYDKKMNRMRAVQYSDFVILTATRNPFLTLQQTFQSYNIPLNAQKVDTYFQRQEIQLMIALLKLIDNPRQDLPLVAILRSFFVGLTDEALSLIRIHHPTGSYYDAFLAYMQQKEDTIAIQLRTFYQQLLHWQEVASQKRLVELIWLIYQETYFLDYVIGLSNGQQRQANLHAFYEQATIFEQSNFKGVFGFIRYIEEVMHHQNDLAEPVTLAEDQNQVRVMTVHASKGLEFPIVYLMNLEKRFNLREIQNKKYVLSKHSGLGSELYDFTTMLKYPSLVKDAIKLEKVLSAKAEEMRKFYVALTRCEQQLILVGTINSQEQWQQQMQQTRELTPIEEKLVDITERKQALSWLEWIRQALSVPHTLKNSVAKFTIEQVDTYFFNTEAIEKMKQSLSHNQTLLSADNWLQQITAQLDQSVLDEKNSSLLSLLEELNQKEYSYQLASNTSSYQSVSELKRLYEEPTHQQLSHFVDRTEHKKTIGHTKERERIQSIRYTKDTFEPPQFMKMQEVTYAQIGTFTHFVLQQLNFREVTQPIEHWIKTQIETMIAQKCLTNEQVQMINLETITEFLKSDTGQLLIHHADTLKREQAFSYLLPAQWLFKAQATDETITQLADNQLLIHGIIDIYFETEDGLVLMDYKTDRYRPYMTQTKEEQIAMIVQKYKFQVSLYAKALSQATSKKVVQVSLVLLDFNEVYHYSDFYEF